MDFVWIYFCDIQLRFCIFRWYIWFALSCAILLISLLLLFGACSGLMAANKMAQLTELRRFSGVGGRLLFGFVLASKTGSSYILV